jgi:hypothetical protein
MPEEELMKLSKLLILIFCFTFSLNVFAQQQNVKKEKVDQEKEVKQEKVEKKKEVKQKNLEKKKENNQEKKLQQDQKKTTKRKYEQTDKKRKKPIDFSNYSNIKTVQQTDNQKTKKVQSSDTPHNQLELKRFKKKKHKPYTHTNIVQQVHFVSPIQYHYTISPRYIYRGLWIRYYFLHDDGYFFYNGYPYFVYNNHSHRYSNVDTGSYDLVDSITDKVYATFYGANLKQSYDRCAELRDQLNNDEGFYRYFCAERFIYDPDFQYDWNPDDYPDWYWY